MTLDELDKFLEERPLVQWQADEEGNFYFRHEQFDKADEKVKITMSALSKISAAELDKVLVNGRNVEQITRITGYFSKIGGWNKGKRGELADRHRVTIEDNLCR
jgi:Anaerobic ribonucleoside-triphosphate reductase